VLEKTEWYKDLGIWTALELKMDKEANEILGKLVNCLNILRQKRVTVRQKALKIPRNIKNTRIYSQPEYGGWGVLSTVKLQEICI